MGVCKLAIWPLWATIIRYLPIFDVKTHLTLWYYQPKIYSLSKFHIPKTFKDQLMGCRNIQGFAQIFLFQIFQVSFRIGTIRYFLFVKKHVLMQEYNHSDTFARYKQNHVLIPPILWHKVKSILHLIHGRKYVFIVSELLKFGWYFDRGFIFTSNRLALQCWLWELDDKNLPSFIIFSLTMHLATELNLSKNNKEMA